MRLHYAESSMRAHEAPAEPWSWWDDAACRGRDLGLWYAEHGSLEAQIAMRVCRGCPVRIECLAAALAEEIDVPSVHGIRGGRSARERRALDPSSCGESHVAPPSA